MKRAIAYVSDIILGRTGEVIPRSSQVELIAQYAADNDIEIVGWFEDEMYNEVVLDRPGIKALLSCSNPFELVLCERVWALSRSMGALEPFFKELDKRGIKLESATTMWDCVSQQCRRRFRGGSKKVPPPPKPVEERREAARPRVSRPSHLHFEHLVK